MNGRNVLFQRAAMSGWPFLIVLSLACFALLPALLAQSDIAERQEGVGQNLGATDVSQLPRARAGRQRPPQKPYKLRPRPRGDQPAVKMDASLLPPRREAGPTTYREAASGSSSAVTAAAAASSFTPAADSPAPSASFSALLDDSTYYNPDTAGAVGPNHLMSIAGAYMRIQDRFGNTSSTNGTMLLTSFWAGTPGLTNLALFDPRVIYDAQGGRWIHALENFDTNNSGLLVAVSRTSDPTGLWNRYFISLNDTSRVLADSPNLGLTKDWIVVTANMYEQTNFTHFSQDVFVFSKGSMFTNGPAGFVRFVYTTDITEENIMVPSVNYDDAPMSSSTNYLMGNYVANTDDNVGFLALYYIYRSGGTTNFNLFRFDVTDFEVGAPGWASNSTVDFFLPQSGTTNKIDAGDCRIQNVIFRADPNQFSIWCVQTIFLPSTPTRSAIQWWEITTGGTVIQRGRINDSSGVKFYAYPSMAVNSRNAVLIGYSRFAANQFPSANYSFRIDADLFSTLRNDVLLKPGEDFYKAPDGSGNNFWGDASATAVDPENDTDFWTLQEYAASPLNGTNRWGTWWGRVSPPVNLSIGMTDAPDPVAAGANVTYSITVTNNELKPVGGVRVMDTLPAGSTFISATPSQGACGATNGTVTCDFGSVGDTGRVSVAIVARLVNTGTINNSATVSAYGEEGSPANNTATVSTTVSPAADLGLTMSGGPDPVTVSNTLAYTLAITNRGPSVAGSVMVSNTLPPNVTYITSSSSQGSCSRNGSVVTCSLGTLAVNGAATVSIQVAPNLSGFYTNRATVSTAAIDGNLSDNTAQDAVRANASPTLGAISDRTIAEDGVLGPLAFSIGDVETPAGSLGLAGFSSNQALVPNGSISFTGAGSSRNITVQPATNASGTTIITRIVTDADGATATNSFLLTVTPVNDPPLISDLPNLAIDEDTTTGAISFTIGDVETPAAALSVSGGSSLTSLVPNGNITFGGSGVSRTVTITPATNQSGSTTITITVSDGTNAVSDMFTLTVNPVNDLPTISDLADRSVNEDTATGAIPFTVGDIETAAGSLTLTASSSNPALLPTNNVTFGGSGASRTVNMLPTTNQFGSAVLTITATDASSGTVSDSFTLTVNPVNDPPSLNAISDVTTNEDAGPVVINLTGLGSGAANESQVLAVSASTSHPGLLQNVQAGYDAGAPTVGTVSFTPALNSNGTATITVTVNDGAASNNISTRVFTVNITAVNDAPVVSAIVDRAINEDSSTNVSVTVSDVETPAASLTVTATSSDQSLVPNANLVVSGVGASRNVSITPAGNMSGSCTIFVIASDGSLSGTNSFLLTVLPVNDPPTISTVADRTISEDTVTNVSFTIGDLETAGSLNVLPSSSNPTVVPNGNLILGGSGANRTLAITPAPDQFGVTIISVVVSDPEGASATNSFTLTVVSANDPPALDAINNVSIPEDSPQQTVNLTGIGSGAANENQSLNVSASSSQPGLIPAPQITYTSGATGTLRFTPNANSNGTAIITVTVNDGGSPNPTFSRQFMVTVTPVNDDPTITALPGVTVNEDAVTNLSFTIGDVETAAGSLTLTADSSNPELITAGEITFGGSGSSRTVTLRPLTNAFGVATIIITVSDPNGGIATSEFDLEVLLVNDAPTVSGPASATMGEDGVAGPLAFGIGDAETDSASLSISLLSSNQTLLPTNRITLGGGGPNRTLTARPATNQFGTTLITVIVGDGTLFTSNSFLLTVTSVNDLPVITGPGNVAISEDSSTGPLAFTVGDVETAAGSLSPSGSSSDTLLVPNGSIVFGGSGANRTVTVTPAQDRFGSATIQVVMADADGGSATNSFVVTVNPVNDPPTMATIPNLATNEDSGPVSVPLTGIGAGGVGETQVISIMVASSDPAVIPTPGLVYSSPAATGTLTFTPVLDAHGAATITVTVMDDAPTNRTTVRTFDITINPVNDAPTLDPLDSLIIPEDSGQQTVNLTGIGSGAANESQTLSVIATSGNPALIPNPQITYNSPNATGSLRFTPVANSNGSALITVTVSDGGAQNPDLVRIFTVTVTNVNDAPSLSTLTDRSTGKNVAVMVPVTVDDLDNAPAGLTLAGASSNTNLANAASFAFGGSGGSRTATILPRTNALGSTLITLTVSDGAGGAASNSFLLTVTNIVAPPVLTGLTDTTIGEDNMITLNFSVSDPEDNASNVVVTTAWTNPSLLNAAGLQPGGSGSSRTLRVVPNTNQSGSAIVTLTANSLSGLSSSLSFVLTVTNVNDAPSISGIPNLFINEDTVTGPLSFTVGDVETAAASLIVSATSSNLALLPNANVVSGGAGADRTVALNPLANASGTSLITLSVADANGRSNSTSFLLTVNPVNDVPALNALSNVTLPINSPPQTVGLSGISAGAGEAASLVISAVSSNSFLIPNPTVSYTNGLGTGVLSFGPLAGASGNSIITVTVNDGGASNNVVTRSFLVTVNPAATSNAPPTISPVASQTTPEDVPLNISATVADTDTPLLNLVVTGTSTNTALVGNSNICVSGSGATRSVKIMPSPNLSGTSLITLRVTDGLATNSTSFLLTVTAVNDPPTLNVLADQALVTGFGDFDLAFNGVSRGPADETTGTLSFTGTASDVNVAKYKNTPPATYTSPNTNGTVRIARGTGPGISVLSLVVSDGSLSTTQNFTAYVRLSSANSANPTITAIANQTTAKGVPTAAIPFTVGDSQTPVALLAVSGKSSNPSLVPSNSIVFGGSGASRTVTVTPAAGQFGTARIYLTVTDTNFGMVTTNFLLTVNQANLPPTISTIAPQVISEETVLGPLSFVVGDIDSAPASLTVTATSDNQTLIPNANLTVGGGGTNRAIMVRPATNQTGTATITLRVDDGPASVSSTFTVTVNNLNDPPTVSTITDQVLNEDTVSAALALTVGDLETPAGSLALSAVSSNPALLPTSNISYGGSGSARTVTLAPVADQFGTASVTVTVNDGAATAMTTFLVTVNPVNDPPALGAISNLSLNQNAAAQTVNLTGIGFGPANEAQTIFITASSSNPGLIPHPTVNYTSPSATGTLTVTPTPGLSGAATITVSVNDAGPASNLVTRTFTVTVNAAPTISALTNLSLLEDIASAPMPFMIGDAETAAGALTVTTFSSNPSVIASGGIAVSGVGASRFVTITPVAEQSGFSIITLAVADGSGNTTSNTFLVTVAPVNDTPALNAIADVSLLINPGLQTVNLSGIGAGAPNESQTLMVMATSANPSLIPNPTVNYSSPAATGSLAFTPAPGATGSVVITVKVMDDGGTDRGASNSLTRSFTITIVSEPPVLSISHDDGNIIVSWPAGAGSNWKLLCAFTVGGTWSLVPDEPALAGNRYSVTLPASGAAKLFRLCDGCSPPPLPLPPSLNITRQGGGIVLSWSVAGGNFVLDEADDIVNPDWTPVSALPSVTGSVATVTLSDNSSTPRFFRLRYQ